MEKLNSLVAKYENVQAELNDEIISAVTRVIQTREQGLALELVGSLPEQGESVNILLN